MILTCFALEDPVLIHQFTFIILVSEASDFPFPQGWLFSDVSIKTAAGCMRPLNPAAALRYLPHSDVKAPKPPHWACSDGTASGSVDRSFAVLCTREGWEVTRAVGGHGAEISGSERQCRQLLYYQTHTQTLAQKLYTVSKQTCLGCNTKTFHDHF